MAANDTKVVVDYEPMGKRAWGNAGQTVLAAAQGLDLFEQGISAPCGGQGTCGRCRVRLAGGQLAPPTPVEESRLTPADLAWGYRLACQAKLISSCKIEIPVTSLIGRQQLQVTGQPQPVAVDRPRSLTGAGEDELLGLAVDLGTTKIAAFLLRLSTGERIAAAGVLNPQIGYGEDLMSRLAFGMANPENARQLARVAAQGINDLVEIMTGDLGIATEQIDRSVIVANTAMHHLFLGLPIEQLALAPYLPATILPVERLAIGVGINLGNQASVYFTPPIGGFVGGDHVAMILASGIHKATGIVLGIDIGTNTEIALSLQGNPIYSCSCASGPAFEGAHIFQGMRAVNGAISEVRFARQGQEVHWQTIGGEKPLGLCGSGIIDAVAELNRAGLIAVNGRLVADHERVRTEPGRPAEFILVAGEDSGSGSDIVITQKDIGEIQLAKAAIASGIQALLKARGMGAGDVDRVVIAGAFGSFLRIESAIAIGMLPDLPRERFAQIGNAAGEGACMSLISSQERRQAEELAISVKHVELAAEPNFKKIFARELKFPKVG